MLHPAGEVGDLRVRARVRIRDRVSLVARLACRV